MGYVNQEDIKPITAKAYKVSNWDKYKVAKSQQEFISLLNILQACDETLDSLHSAYFNGYDIFADIYREGGWGSDREIVESLYEFCKFFTESEFIDYILEQRDNYESEAEYVDAMKEDASDEPGKYSDTQITKTDAGYVVRVWY